MCRLSTSGISTSSHVPYNEWWSKTITVLLVISKWIIGTSLRLLVCCLSEMYPTCSSISSMRAGKSDPFVDIFVTYSQSKCLQKTKLNLRISLLAECWYTHVVQLKLPFSRAITIYSILRAWWNYQIHQTYTNYIFVYNIQLWVIWPGAQRRARLGFLVLLI